MKCRVPTFCPFFSSLSYIFLFPWKLREVLPIFQRFAHLLLCFWFLSVYPLYRGIMQYARAVIQFWYQYTWITQLAPDFPVSSRLASIVDILMQFNGPKQVKFGSFQKLLRLICFVCSFIVCVIFFRFLLSLFLFPHLYSWHLAISYANA